MLRDELLHVCHEHGLTVHATTQAFVDLLMFSVIAIAHSADDAERDIRNICSCMQDNIRRSYSEFHDMAQSQRATRQ